MRSLVLDEPLAGDLFVALPRDAFGRPADRGSVAPGTVDRIACTSGPTLEGVRAEPVGFFGGSRKTRFGGTRQPLQSWLPSLRRVPGGDVHARS